MHSHFGGFLLHRGCAKLPCGFPTADILSTGCNAVSPRQNVDRPHHIGMGSVATGHAPEDRLRLSVLSIHMPTLGACPAGVPGIDGNQLAAAPLHLVGELAPELRPTLVQDGLVQATLGAHVASGRHSAALGRCAHVPDLQILDDHHGMLRSDLAAGLVQEVLAHVGDAAVQALHAGLGLVPVPAALDLARHAPLVAGKAHLVTLEAGQRREKRAIAQGGEPGHPHVDAHRRGSHRHRDSYLALGLDRHEPPARPQAHRGIPDLAQHRATQAQPHPAQLGQEDACAWLVELELLGVGIAKRRHTAPALETREGSAPSKEVLVGTLKVLERLLQRVRGRVRQPGCLWAVAPGGQVLGHGHVADELAARLVIGLLQRQGLVEDEPARARKPRHLALLRTIGHQFKFEGLQALHGINILGLTMARNWDKTDYRRGRTVVSLLHVHLVFVTKYRRDVLSERAIEVIREACRGVCADFSATMVELNGEDDHVHLLVEYPATVALSRLVNSLKGVSSRMLRAKGFPEVQRRLWGGHLWSPSYFAVSCGGAPVEIVRQYIEDQRK